MGRLHCLSDEGCSYSVVPWRYIHVSYIHGEHEWPIHWRQLSITQLPLIRFSIILLSSKSLEMFYFLSDLGCNFNVASWMAHVYVNVSDLSTSARCYLLFSLSTAENFEEGYLYFWLRFFTSPSPPSWWLTFVISCSHDNPKYHRNTISQKHFSFLVDSVAVTTKNGIPLICSESPA